MASKNPLNQYTEQELHSALTQQATNYLQYNYNDYAKKLDRRRHQKHSDCFTREMKRLSLSPCPSSSPFSVWS